MANVNQLFGSQPLLDNLISNGNTDIKLNKKNMHIPFYFKRNTHYYKKMNDNLDIDSTIAESVNAHRLLTTILEGRICWLKTITLGTKIMNDTSNRGNKI